MVSGIHTYLYKGSSLMHKADNSFKTSISIIVALLMAITLITPLAMPAHATPVDASVGLDFSESADILKSAPVGSSHTYRTVLTGVDAVVTVIQLVNSRNDSGSSEILDVTDELDDTDSDATLNRWIRSQLRPSSVTPAGEYSIMGFTIDFVSAADNSIPVTITGLKLNAYDIDNMQYIEATNVSSYQRTDDTIVRTVQNLGSGVIRFLSENIDGTTGSRSGSQVHSYGEARVQINFLDTNTVTLRMATKSGYAVQDFDFSTGVNWINAAGTILAEPTNLIQPPAPSSGSTSSTPAPQKQHVSTLNTTPAPGQEVAMFGSYFGGVTEVYVGGVKVEILSKTENRVNIRMPRGLTGALDVELKSPLGSLLLPKHFTIGKLPAAGTRKATIIVGGFDHNSRKLTARMKARIDRWLDRNSDLSTLTCTGFTSLPRRTTDVELSTNRGTTACA
jgi:hypothetical protein